MLMQNYNDTNYIDKYDFKIWQHSLVPQVTKVTVLMTSPAELGLNLISAGLKKIRILCVEREDLWCS